MLLPIQQAAWVLVLCDVRSSIVFEVNVSTSSAVTPLASCQQAYSCRRPLFRPSGLNMHIKATLW